MATSYGTINPGNSCDLSCERKNFLQKLRGTSAVYTAAISAFMFVANVGLSVSYTGPSAIKMMKPQSRVQATAEDISWIASIGAISAALGGAASGYLSNKLGRKGLLMYTSFPFLIGWLMVGYGSNMLWIYAGRFLTGLCCGLVSVVATYIIEISTPNIRGMIGAWFNVAFAVGVLLSMSLGMVLTWSWLAVFGGFLVTAAVSIFSLMPESPHWLVANGYKNEALASLQFLRGDSDKALQEYRILRRMLDEEVERGISFNEFFQPMLYKPIILSVGLLFFQQFCGVNALVSYTVEIFKRAESSLDPSVATIIVFVTQLLATLISSVLMDKAGRKVLFIVSGSFASVGLTILGVFGRLTSTGVISHSRFGWVPVLGFIVFIVAFNLGYGPVPWVLAPEMVPTHARGAVVGIAAVSSGLFTFIVVKSFDDLRQLLNDYGIYLLYAFLSLLGCFFGCFLPETKGKPLEEIQAYFRRRKPRDVLSP